MSQILRTTSTHPDFVTLVKQLDAYLAIMDGEEHAFYDQFNKIAALNHVVVIFECDIAVGCGAIKPIDAHSMEVKRMFTLPQFRGKGIASKVLLELETWAAELGFKSCVLETGLRQVEAVAFYKKMGYRIIPNYGQYIGVENSVCFEKLLPSTPSKHTLASEFMPPRFETIQEKTLVGMSLEMSFAADKTPILWRTFMPRRKEVESNSPHEFYSLQVFPVGFFDSFNPNTGFVKWALSETATNSPIPEGMQKFALPSGLYAVFIHHGPAAEAPKTYNYIFGEWLPQSDFVVDNRPHFEILPEGYNPMARDSEEEVWIPIRKK